MVGDQERVILVNVLPPSDDKPASIEYIYAEDNKTVNIDELNTPNGSKVCRVGTNVTGCQ
jgi:hypothetical protein